MCAVIQCVVSNIAVCIYKYHCDTKPHKTPMFSLLRNGRIHDVCHQHWRCYRVRSIDMLQLECKVLLCKFLKTFTYSLDPDQSFDVEEQGTLRPRGGAIMTLRKRRWHNLRLCYRLRSDAMLTFVMHVICTVTDWACDRKGLSDTVYILFEEFDAATTCLSYQHGMVLRVFYVVVFEYIAVMLNKLATHYLRLLKNAFYST